MGGVLLYNRIFCCHTSKEVDTFLNITLFLCLQGSKNKSMFWKMYWTCNYIKSSDLSKSVWFSDKN